jgi:hypothetical protein
MPIVVNAVSVSDFISWLIVTSDVQ